MKKSEQRLTLDRPVTYQITVPGQSGEAAADAGLLCHLAVHRELFAKLGPESSRLEDALQSFLQVGASPTMPPAVAKATRAKSRHFYETGGS